MSYTCDKAQENISAYVDGELGLIESIRLKLHTLKCEKCRSDLEFEKSIVETMSAESFFIPHDLSAKIHRQLEIEYNNRPAKENVKVEFKNANLSLSSTILNWVNEKKTYLALGACALVFVFGLSVYQLSVNNTDVANVPTDEPQMVYSPKGMARVASMEDITDENIASQEVAGVNQNVFDKFRNKYMTKKFVPNFSVMNDTVSYSTAQKRGITSIMRTIKEVVTDAVSGKNVNVASLPKVNTSFTSLSYVRPTTASAMVAVDLRSKVPVSVGDETMYGVLMVDKTAVDTKANSGVSVASAGNYDIRTNDKSAYTPESQTNAFVYSDVVNYSSYTPPSLSIKSATFTANKANASVIKDILYEFKSSIDMKETDSDITISIDSVNYEVLVSRLKMSDACSFKQVQGRDYSMSYNNLIKKQATLMNDPAKYSELEDVTEEIEELLSKLGSNTIKINLD